MASALYNSFRVLQLTGTAAIQPTVHNLRVALVDGDDHPFSQSDDFFSDVRATEDVGGAVVAISGNLASVTISSSAVLDAADLTGGSAFSSVTGDEFEYVMMYRTTGTPATSSLIANFDDFTGLPFTPNGSDVSLTWSASGIFKLGGA